MIYTLLYCSCSWSFIFSSHLGVLSSSNVMSSGHVYCNSLFMLLMLNTEYLTVYNFVNFSLILSITADKCFCFLFFILEEQPNFSNNDDKIVIIEYFGTPMFPLSKWETTKLYVFWVCCYDDGILLTIVYIVLVTSH